MRTLATGCCEPGAGAGSQRGFTLLELLVALVIMAVTISLATLALRPDPRAMLRDEGDRLALLLGLASEESMLAGTPMAWVGREDGYEFQARELTDAGPDWRVLMGDDLLHPRRLPEGAYIRGIRADGRVVEPGQRVALGGRGAQELNVEISMGEARASISGSNGQFRAEIELAGGT